MSVIEKAVQAHPPGTKHARRVKDVMNPDIMTVADDMTTDELVRFLNEREITEPARDLAVHVAHVRLR